MNNQQSFLKVRLSSPIKFGALSAPQPTRFGGNGEASRNAIVLFSKKPNLILHIFSDFFLLNLTHATLFPRIPFPRVGYQQRLLSRWRQ